MMKGGIELRHQFTSSAVHCETAIGTVVQDRHSLSERGNVFMGSVRDGTCRFVI